MACFFNPAYLPAQVIDALFGDFTTERQVLIICQEGGHLVNGRLFDFVAIEAVTAVSRYYTL